MSEGNVERWNIDRVDWDDQSWEAKTLFVVDFAGVFNKAPRASRVTRTRQRRRFFGQDSVALLQRIARAYVQTSDGRVLRRFTGAAVKQLSPRCAALRATRSTTNM